MKAWPLLAGLAASYEYVYDARSIMAAMMNHHHFSNRRPGDRDSIAQTQELRRALVRPTQPNPRTGLPSHLGPTLERIDRLLEQRPTPDVPFFDELCELDADIHDARGHEEVLVLLERWELLSEKMAASAEGGGECGAASTPKRQESQPLSQSCPVLPAVSEPERGRFAPSAQLPRGALKSQRTVLWSPRGGARRLCAFDEADAQPAGKGRFDLAPTQQIELRALAKATAILLDALLASLLKLTERVIAARQWWTYYSVRPAQYVLWGGARVWLGVHPLKLGETYFGAVAQPAHRMRALSEVVALMASHIGRVHASLVDFLRCGDRAQLQDAVRTGAETLHGLLSLDPVGAQPPPSAAAGAGGGSHASLLEARRRMTAAAKRWHVYEARLNCELAGLGTPTHLARNWVRYVALGGLALGAATCLRRTGADELAALARGLAGSLSQWWAEHLKQPLSYMYHELVHRRYLVVSDPHQLEDARRSLDKMVSSFFERHNLRIFPDETIAAVAQQSAPRKEGASAALASATGLLPSWEYVSATAASAAGGAMGGGVPADAAAALLAQNVAAGSLKPSEPASGPRLQVRHTTQSAAGQQGGVGSVEKQLQAISRLFEKQAGSAVYNLVSGDLVEIMCARRRAPPSARARARREREAEVRGLSRIAAASPPPARRLIQMSLLKKEVFEMMAAIDQLMRENYFTASMMAAVPGTLAVGAVLMVLWKGVRKMRARWSRKHSRRSVQKMMRQSLRDIERLLLRYHMPPPAGEDERPAADASRGGCGPEPLTLQDRGSLVLELHNVLECVRHHLHLFEHSDLQNFVEDLRDLECDSLSASQKLHTVGRVYRTQPILGMSASSRLSWGPLSDAARP